MPATTAICTGPDIASFRLAIESRQEFVADKCENEPEQAERDSADGSGERRTEDRRRWCRPGRLDLPVDGRAGVGTGETSRRLLL